MSYFDSWLLADAIAVSKGLFLSPNGAFPSQQIVFKFFKAKLLPLLSPDDPQTAQMNLTLKIRITWHFNFELLNISKMKFKELICSSCWINDEENWPFNNKLRRDELIIAWFDFTKQNPGLCPCSERKVFRSPIDNLRLRQSRREVRIYNSCGNRHG